MQSTYGDWMWRHFFGMVLQHAPDAVFQVRSGAILLQELSSRLTGVERGTVGKATSVGQTLEDDKNLRKTLAFDFADSASILWAKLDPAQLTRDLLTHPVECITVSDIRLESREVLHDALRHPAYLGALEIDRGNPVMLRLAVDLLVPYYQYNGGILQVIKGFEAEDDDADLVPHWAKDLGFRGIEVADVPISSISADHLSARGRQSFQIVETRGAPAHSEIVLSALWEKWEQDRASAITEAVRFSTQEQGVPVVNVRKLTEYALNDEHPEGKHKARLFRDLLGITRKDWRFLAEQLVAGLQKQLVQRPRTSVHGVQYHVDVPVVGRNGQKKLVRSAWIIREHEPPSLTTVLIPGAADTDETPALSGKIVPLAGRHPDWQALYDTAHLAGMESAAAWTTTPMFVEGEVVGEGECGTAWVQLSGKSGFGRWLLKHELADRGHPSGVWVFSKHQSQSVERAVKYCEAFASALRANGVECVVQSRLT